MKTEAIRTPVYTNTAGHGLSSKLTVFADDPVNQVFPVDRDTVNTVVIPSVMALDEVSTPSGDRTVIKYDLKWFTVNSQDGRDAISQTVNQEHYLGYPFVEFFNPTRELRWRFRSGVYWLVNQNLQVRRIGSDGIITATHQTVSDRYDEKIFIDEYPDKSVDRNILPHLISFLMPIIDVIAVISNGLKGLAISTLTCNLLTLAGYRHGKFTIDSYIRTIYFWKRDDGKFWSSHVSVPYYAHQCDNQMSQSDRVMTFVIHGLIGGNLVASVLGFLTHFISKQYKQFVYDNVSTEQTQEITSEIDDNSAAEIAAIAASEAIVVSAVSGVSKDVSDLNGSSLIRS